jgi:CubicO group peptidase (beta-lactamase class C family)
LKAAIAKILTRTHVPGVGIALVTKDKVTWTGGVGKADLASGRNVDGDTMFRVGSITKGFVALSLLQQEEKGKVSLDAKLADLAPEVPLVNPWEQTDPVRVANLLEHTAGFDDFPLAEFYDYSGHIPLLKTLQMFPEPQHVRWRPGTFYSYSNPGYGVAGYLVEKITGQTCEDYIAANILRPLGMMNSDMRLTPEVKAALAQGYEFDPPRAVPYLPILLRSAGEMKSSPNEMARFVRMMLNRGSLEGTTVVRPESLARMETAETSLASRSGLKYGYGLGNEASVARPYLTYGHGGGLDGFLSNYQYIPERGVGYFFSINDSGLGVPLEEIDDLLFAYVTRGMTPPPKPSAAALEPRIEAATGMYEFASPRNQWTQFLTELLVTGWVYINGGNLYRRGLIPGTRQKFIYLGNGQVRTDKESGASGVFCKGPDGETYGCGALVAFRRVNPLWPVTRFVLAVLALLTMASSILFAIIWIPRKLIGRLRGVPHLSVRAVPLLAVLTLSAIFWRASGQPPFVLGRPNAVTITILALSIIFPLLSVAALLLVLRSWRFEVNRAVRIHSLLVALACCLVAWFLAYWGLIGARVWAL